MDFRPFGTTGLSVSAISFGTVSLGVDYGIDTPDGFGPPSATESETLLRKAADEHGINLFDTAPAYGIAEQLLGNALGGCRDCIFATKIAIPRGTDAAPCSSARLRKEIFASLDQSLRNLRRDVLDIVQVHNATIDVIANGEIVALLAEARAQGKLRFIGASVYTETEALAVIEAGGVDSLQVPFSILDQRMAALVFLAAQRTGIAVMNRSSLLKGALSAKAPWLPAGLEALQKGSTKVMEQMAGSWERLPEIALRYCLSMPQISTVLAGVRTVGELEQAVAAERNGPLSGAMMAIAPGMSLSDERLLNPVHWPVA